MTAGPAASSIFHNQGSRLCELVQEAARLGQPRTPGLPIAVAALGAGTLAGEAALADSRFLNALSNEALLHAAAGEAEAAFAWGLAAYIGQRRFAHAWLAPVALAFAARKLRQFVPPDPHSTASRGPGPSNKVSRGIMQYWDTEAVPQDVRSLIDGWAQLHEDHPHELYNDAAARAFLDAHFGPTTRAYYDLLPFPASKSDLFRLCWLLQVGGIYVDADEQLLGRLSALLPEGEGLILTWTDADPPCINNNFVAARPSHPVMAYALDLAMSHLAGSRGRAMKLPAWILTGPGVFSMSVMDLLCRPDRGEAALSDVLFHSESDYRRTACCPGGLAYQSDPQKNWRLSELNW